MSDGQRLAMAGVVLGLAAAYAGGRVVASSVFEMRAADPGNTSWQHNLSVSLSKVGNMRLAAGGFGVVYLPPAEFATFMEKSTNDLGATMKAVGIVK